MKKNINFNLILTLPCKFKAFFLHLFINYLRSDCGNKIYSDEKGAAR